MIITESTTKAVILSEFESSTLEVINNRIELKMKTATNYNSSGSIVYFVDLGSYFISYLNLTKSSSVPSGATLNIYTSSSDDKVNYSPYVLIDASGKINSPNARYLKIKIDMNGNPVVGNVTRNDFISSESNQFETNSNVVFDGSLHLKTTYPKSMVKNAQYSGEGYVYYLPLNKNSYKKIESLTL